MISLDARVAWETSIALDFSTMASIAGFRISDFAFVPDDGVNLGLVHLDGASLHVHGVVRVFGFGGNHLHWSRLNIGHAV